MRHLLLCAALALSGCAYQMTLMPRAGGDMGTGKATSNGFSNSGDMTITLTGKTYAGKWVTVPGGGDVMLLQTYGKGGVTTGAAYMQATL